MKTSRDAVVTCLGKEPHKEDARWTQEGEWYQLYQIGFGGIPGRPVGDGPDGHSLWPAFTNVPNEFLESYFPLRIDTYETIPDSGGAGLHRGGGRLEGEAQYDARLFNQSGGMDAGFGADDDYSAYSKPLFNRGAAESVIDAFRGLDAHFLVQEYVKEAKGADIRCFVIGDKVVASMKRQGKEGEFRSNLHRGGSASVVKITPEERSTAVRAAKIMGLNVAGVDLLRSNHGPVVMEVNSSPGLEGIEGATGKDVAGQIIGFIETHSKRGKTRTRGAG